MPKRFLNPGASRAAPVSLVSRRSRCFPSLLGRPVGGASAPTVPHWFRAAYCVVTIATNQMVVDQSSRLHQGVADRRSDKPKAALLQRLGKRVRLRSAGRDVALTSPTVSFRRLLDEAPDEAVETAELLLYRQQGPSIADGAL